MILAAGTSSRFPGTKQLAELGGKTLIERVIDVVPQDEVRETVVVLGHEATAVTRALRDKKGVKVVINKDYAAGMGNSIRAGVLALAKDAEGAMLLLGDQPFVTRALLRRMSRRFKDSGPGRRIVAAAHGELVAPPVIFSKEYFEELAALQGHKGARSVIEKHRMELSLVKVRSEAVLADVDTREDLKAARRSFLKV